MRNEAYSAGALRVRYDNDARTVTEWDAQGVVIYTRPYNTEENAAADAAETARAESDTEAAIRDAARTAHTANRDYLNITPTQGQALAQITALTRQVNHLIRLAVTDYTGTD